MEVSPFVILLAMVFGIAFVLSKNWIYSSINAMDNDAAEFGKIMLILFDGIKDIIAILYLLIYLLYEEVIVCELYLNFC